MTNRQRTWLNMMNTVVGVATDSENQSVTDLIPKYKEGIELLQQKISAINITIQKQGGDNKGYFENKRLIKKNACVNAIAVIAPAMGWCEAITDTVLKEKIKYSYTDLFKTSDAVFAPTLQSVYDLLFPFATTLIDYGVTSDSFAAFKNSIDSFYGCNSDPRQAISDRKSQTKKLDQQMRDANSLCINVLDRLAIAYKVKNYNYWMKYKIARKLVPHGRTTTKYRGVMLNEVTGKPLMGVTVVVEGTDLIAISDLNGKVVIDKVLYGVRKLKISADGMRSQLTEPIEFKKGKTVTLNFSLVPAFVLPSSTPVTVVNGQ